jgi:hypothetical protein
MERAMGIEPTSEAWEARNKNLKTLELAALSISPRTLNWKMDGKRNSRKTGCSASESREGLYVPDYVALSIRLETLCPNIPTNLPAPLGNNVSADLL